MIPSFSLVSDTYWSIRAQSRRMDMQLRAQLPRLELLVFVAIDSLAATLLASSRCPNDVESSSRFHKSSTSRVNSAFSESCCSLTFVTKF